MSGRAALGWVLLATVLIVSSWANSAGHWTFDKIVTAGVSGAFLAFVLTFVLLGLLRVSLRMWRQSHRSGPLTGLAPGGHLLQGVEQDGVGVRRIRECPKARSRSLRLLFGDQVREIDRPTVLSERREGET